MSQPSLQPLNDQPTQAKPPAPATAEERTPAIIMHLSPLADFLLPTLGSLIGPLVAWLAYRDRSASLDAVGKEVLNFRLSMWLYGAVITAIGFALFGLGLLGGAVGAAAGSPDTGAFAFMGSFFGFFLVFLPVLAVMSFIPLIFMLIAVSRASNGENYRYPLTIRFLK